MPKDTEGGAATSVVEHSSAIDQLSGPGADEGGPSYDEPEQSDQPEETEGESETDPEEAESGEGAEAAEATEDLDPEIAKLAEEHGIDPATLKGLSIAQILQQLTQSAKEPEKPAAPAEVNWMDGLEAPKEEKPEEAPPPDPKQVAAPEDIGAKWRDEEDAFKDLDAAYAEGDYRKIGTIHNAIFQRQFVGMAMPLIEHMLAEASERIRGEFGDVVPRVREDVARQQLNGDRDWAIEQIRAADSKNSALLDALFQAKNGEVVEFNGKKWPATPYNQILAENPWMLDINAKDENPRVAQRKTFHARFSAVLSRFREKQAGQLKPDKAKELVETGKQIERRRHDDRVRQGLNAGRGASSASGKPPRGYVHELNSVPGMGSLDELMSG